MPHFGPGALVVWVDARTLVAVRLLDYATFHAFGAAITAIERTPFVVVVVVAVAVSLVTWRSTFWTCRALVVWVDARTLVAVLFAHCTTWCGLWAAITAIERTPFVVVLVGAIAVSLVFGEFAFF